MNGNSSKTAEKKGGQPAEKQSKPVTKPKNTAPKAESKEGGSEKECVSQLSFYEEVYKQVESGTDGIVAVMPYVETKAMKNLFAGQRKSYETMAIDLKTKIGEMGGRAEKPNIITKMMMKGGTMMETMMDQSESKLAELVIKGVNMGIISLTRLMNDCDGKEVDVQFGNKLMSLYDKQLEVLKTYL